MTLPVVEVLLSTFNAGPHLRPLLRSVASQEGAEVRIRVRDDGSTDGTREHLLTEPELAGSQVDLGEHLGPGRSYLHLLGTSTGAGRFVAFCDQDDIWLPHKLRAAVERLSISHEPTLYCGRMILADANLRSVGMSPLPRRPISLANALVENIAMGPTIVLNPEGVRLLSTKSPTSVVMHDAWAYLVFSALGRVVYNPEPTVLYRLHARNHFGFPLHRGFRFDQTARRRAQSYLEGQVAQAEELLRLYGDLLSDLDRQLIARFCDSNTAHRRLRYVIRPDVYRQRRLDNIALRGVLASRDRRGASPVARGSLDSTASGTEGKD
jgi:glycosyltransferase involved in cell wall biosynthesis